MNEKHLHINMLGGFSMTSAHNTIDDQSNRSKKLWTLLEYLIANRHKDISQNDLIDVLWPEGEEVGDPANTLKTLVYRVRAVLDELHFVPGKNLVLYRRGAYHWNNDLNVTVDSEEFDRLCDEAAAGDDDCRLALMMQALELYKGDFLPRSALDDWATPLSAYYRARYIKTVHDAVDLLNTAARFDEAIQICQRAVIIDPYDESIHLHLIQALVETGAQQEAMKHYNYVTELFFTRFGVTPSEELTTLYKEIVKTSKTTEMDLGVIKEGLAEQELIPGAFFCEYEFFKDIYRLQARSAGRNGQIVHIALITVMDGYGKKLTQTRLNTAMDRLKDVIRTSLRRGDVFTRYSVSQFLLMLPSASFENADMVLSRVTRGYKRIYPKMEILLHYSVLPLDPLM